MKDNSIKYKESVKKQITYALIWLGIVALSGYSLYPVNTLDKIIIFAPIATVFAVIAIWMVNKTAKEASCPFCKCDLYDVIQSSEQTNLDFKYCPACGNEVQI